MTSSSKPVTKKSGKGNNHGFVSEVCAYMTVKQGHEEEARAAALRFGEMLRIRPEGHTEDGLRDARLVNFDDGRRLHVRLWLRDRMGPVRRRCHSDRWHRTLSGLDASIP